MKKITKLILMSLFALTLTTGCGCDKKTTKKEEIKESVNTNKEVIEDKVVEDLKLTNTSLVSKGESDVLVTKVTNDTNEDKEVRIFNIYVKDKDDNIITTLQGYVGGVVPKGESREITSNVDRNLDNAYKVEYELIK